MNSTDNQNPPVATGDGAGSPKFIHGSWVRIDQPGSVYHDKDAVYLEPSDTGDSHLVRFTNGMTNWYATHQIGTRMWPENATMEEMQEVVRRLNNDITEWQGRYARCDERRTVWMRNYNNDMGHWERVLRDQKDLRDWCDEGTNQIIDSLNRGFIGQWHIDEYVSIVEREVRIRGEVVTTITVHVKDGDDPDDPDNWVDEDGDSIDTDEVAHSDLATEYRINGWDEWEVIS